MPVKITKNFKTIEQLKNVSVVFNPIVKSFIGAMIKDLILKGTSPVQGEGRFQKYSKSYLNSIESGNGDFSTKKKSPVNLILSGDMMKSLEVDADKEKVVVRFTSIIAKYHNELGASRKKVIRRLLPTKDGETFSRAIMKKIKEALSQAVKIIARR